MSEPVLEHKCQVALIDGPKDGWVYEFPMHWEVRDGILVWEPPHKITTASGLYVWDRLETLPYTYHWMAIDAD